MYGINNINLSVRGEDLSEDTFGTIFWNDNHYPEIERLDQFSSTATILTAGSTSLGGAHVRGTTSVSGVYSSYASFTNPWWCVYGASGAANNWGPVTTPANQLPPYQLTYSPAGDGCPSVVAYLNTGKYNQVSDGYGNLYYMDNGWSAVREIQCGQYVPGDGLATAANPEPVVQAIQVHFDAGNPPAGVSVTTIPDGGTVGYTTTAFSITPSTDFTINTTIPVWPLGSLYDGAMNALAIRPCPTAATSSSGRACPFACN